jgi:hypothetical protein
VSLPRFVRVRCIRHLARITADAFKVPAPDIRGPWTAALDAYARFTDGEARRVLACGLPLEPLQMRLFSSARDLGSRLRTGLLIRSPRRAAGAVQDNRCRLPRFGLPVQGSIVLLFHPLHARDLPAHLIA